MTKDISSDERISYESNKLLGRAYTLLGTLGLVILCFEAHFNVKIQVTDFAFILGLVSYWVLIQFCRKGLIENNTASIDIVVWSLITFPLALIGWISKIFDFTMKTYVYFPLVIAIGIILYCIAQKIYDMCN